MSWPGRWELGLLLKTHIERDRQKDRDKEAETERRKEIQLTPKQEVTE